MKIRNKIIFSSFIGILISSLLIGALFYFFLFEKAKEERIAFFHTQNTLFLQKLDDFIKYNQAITKQYSFSQEFNSLVDKNYIIRELSRNSSSRLIEEIVNSEKFIKHIYILNKNNKETFNKIIPIDIVNFNANGLLITKNRLFLSHSLNKKQGTLIFEIDLIFLKNTLNNILEKKVEYFLFSKDLQLLLNSDNFIMTKHIVFPENIHDIDKDGYIYRLQVIEGYLVGTKVSKDKLFSRINGLLIIVSSFIILATLISLLTSMKISTSITNSIDKLVTVLESNKEGKYKQVSINGIDEIEFFAKKYNEMIIRISNFTSELEQKVEERTNELEIQKKELKRLSQTDKLTGVYNREKLDEILEDKGIDINKDIYTIVLVDIDYFKQVNDEVGHHIGDEVLKKFSLILQNNIKKTDFVGRWGGEEFMIICPNSTIKQVYLMSEKIREKISKTNFANNLKITASFGVAQYDKKVSQKDLFVFADKALYKAKKEGRNRVVCASYIDTDIKVDKLY